MPITKRSLTAASLEEHELASVSGGADQYPRALTVEGADMNLRNAQGIYSGARTQLEEAGRNYNSWGATFSRFLGGGDVYQTQLDSARDFYTKAQGELYTAQGEAEIARNAARFDDPGADLAATPSIDVAGAQFNPYGIKAGAGAQLGPFYAEAGIDTARSGPYLDYGLKGSIPIGELGPAKLSLDGKLSDVDPAQIGITGKFGPAEAGFAVNTQGQGEFSTQVNGTSELGVGAFGLRGYVTGGVTDPAPVTRDAPAEMPVE